MTQEHMEILDIASLLAGSKRTSYRESILSYVRVLVGFLQDNGLVNRRLLIDGEVPSNKFRILKSDLTNEGYELIQYGLDEWTKSIQAGNPIEDASILKIELARIRVRAR
jgi:hypothetical protein